MIKVAVIVGLALAIGMAVTGSTDDDDVCSDACSTHDEDVSGCYFECDIGQGHEAYGECLHSCMMAGVNCRSKCTEAVTTCKSSCPADAICFQTCFQEEFHNRV